jgi:hypothetical protein
MKNYEITFERPNGDWTWIYAEARDFHHAIIVALEQCPRGCQGAAPHLDGSLPRAGKLA